MVLHQDVCKRPRLTVQYLTLLTGLWPCLGVRSTFLRACAPLNLMINSKNLYLPITLNLQQLRMLIVRRHVVTLDVVAFHFGLESIFVIC